MNHASLFSGIGGPDLAAQWMGWANIFHCEINPFGRRVLNYYWPESKSYENIITTDFTIHRGTIDVLTGGFPCQPYSQAGKRLGNEDDRHLWPEMLRAIREVQPTWIVGENVSGLVNWNGGLVFHEVQTDLETEGYEVQPYVLPAVSVNAPHRRDRVWFVAYSSMFQRYSQRKEDKHPGPGRDARSNINGDAEQGSSSNTQSKGSRGKLQQRQGEREPRGCNSKNNASNTNGKRQSGEEHRETKSGRATKESVPNYWQDFPTQSPICNGNDGISSRLDGITFPKWRNESIKAGGNAIVPQAIHQIFKTIEAYEIEESFYQ